MYLSVSFTIEDRKNKSEENDFFTLCKINIVIRIKPVFWSIRLLK
jgi:hypothetical protein